MPDLIVPPLDAESETASELHRRSLVGPGLGFGILAAASIIAHFTLMLAAPGPLGIDPGNWLAIGRDLLGRSVRPASITYPPLIPLLVVGAVNLLGLNVGLRALAALLGAGPAIGAYLVGRWEGAGWGAGVCAALLLTAGSAGDAAAWGGYPQLLGLGLLPIALWLLADWLRAGRRQRLLCAALSCAALAATSHLVLAMYGVSALILIAIHTAAGRSAPLGLVVRRAFKFGALGGLACVPIIPTYVQLARTLVPTFAGRPTPERVEGTSVLGALDFLVRDFRPFWRGAMVGAIVIPGLYFARRRSPHWQVASTLTVAGAGFALIAHEYRFLFVIPTAVALCLGLAWQDADARLKGSSRTLAWVAIMSITACLAAQSLLGLRLFREQASYYAFLTPDKLAGLHWLEAHSKENEVVAVSTDRGLLFGWWVEGVSRRRAFSASDNRFLYFQVERTRAALANRLFSPSAFLAPTAIASASPRIDFLFVLKSAPGYSPVAVDRAAQAGASIGFSNADVVILKLSRTSHSA